MAMWPTPHIDARPGDFGKTVLMPGDPLRAKYIAENFLENAVLVNNLRGVQGYTGAYRGRRISVMASGMGMPSMGIYSWELYHIFEVENILRVGSTGAIQDSIGLGDLVIAQAACTDSDFAAQYHLPGTFAPIADYGLLSACVRLGQARGLHLHVGNILSSDRFYEDQEGIPEGLRTNASWQKMGVLAIDMETAALYMTAARCGKRALSLCTVSDQILRAERMSAEQRQTGLADMIGLALDTAVELQE